MKAVTGYAFTEKQLRNKFNGMRRIHTEFRSPSDTGTGWDPTTHKVTSTEKNGCIEKGKKLYYF